MFTFCDSGRDAERGWWWAEGSSVFTGTGSNYPAHSPTGLMLTSLLTTWELAAGGRGSDWYLDSWGGERQLWRGGNWWLCGIGCHPALVHYVYSDYTGNLAAILVYPHLIEDIFNTKSPSFKSNNPFYHRHLAFCSIANAPCLSFMLLKTQVRTSTLTLSKSVLFIFYIISCWRFSL